MKKFKVSKNKFVFWVSSSANDDFWKWFEENTWEPETFIIFDKFIRKNDIVLDVGAWIGPTTLYAAKLADHVFTLEPDLISFRELQTNVNLNPSISKKITCIQAALSTVSKKTLMYERDYFGDSSTSLIRRIDASNKVTSVESLTLSDLIKRYEIKKIDFIKIDIEGYEYTIVPAIRKTLKQYRPTLYISLHPTFLSESILFPILQIHPLLREIYAVPKINRFIIYCCTRVPMFRLVLSLRDYAYFYDENCEEISKLRLLYSRKYAYLSAFVVSNEKL